MKNAGAATPSALAAKLDRVPSRSLGDWPAWLGLSLGLLLTAAASWQVQRHVEADALRRFSFATDQLTIKLQDRLAAKSQLLQTGALLWSETSNPTPEHWQRFVKSLRAQSAFDTLLGVGFIAAAHPDHSPLVFLDSQISHHANLLGLDMNADPVLRKAMEQARDTGYSVLSGQVALATGLPFGASPPVAMLVPVYAPEGATENLAMRKTDLRGWFFVPMRLAELTTVLMQDWHYEPDMNLRISLQESREFAALKPQGQQSDPLEWLTSGSPMRQQRLVAFNGHPWLLTLESRQTKESLNYTQVWVSVGVGLALSLLLFALMLSIIRTRGRAVQLARRLTQKLRHADRALRLSEARLRSTLDTLPYQLVELDLQGRYHDLHGPETDMLGMASDIHSGQTVLDLLPPPAARTYLNALQEAFDKGRAFGYQFSITQPEGERWFELSVSRKPMAMGELPRFIVLSRDITEQRDNQLSLQKAMAFQETMLDASSHAIIATTLRGTVTHINRSAETMLGYPMTEMLGQSSVQRLFEPAEVQARALAADLQVPEAGEPSFETLVSLTLDGMMSPNGGRPREWQVLRRDGSSFPALVPAVALRGGDNDALSGFLFVIIDVSERSRNHLALQTARESADKANHAKSRFLAAASHDLRQPLAALSLYLSLLRGQLPQAHKPLMRNVDDCVASLTELLDDLLDVSKLDAGVVNPERSDFSVDTLLRRQLSVHTGPASLKGLRLRFRPSNFIGRTDPVLFGRIVGNLVSNAIRYTEHGGVLLTCRRRGERWWVEVRDTGIGIPPDQTSVIFEEYRQLENHTRNRGSGLGLAIVAKTAAVLGLEVRVRSTPGRGSLFAIELPAGRVIEREELPQAPVALTQRLRLALVDDNAQIVRALGLLLQGAGHQVVGATSLSALLTALGDEAPDLVISDYRLGAGETGYDVIDALRQRFAAQLPALIITGDTDPALIRSMAEHGIEVQYKPLNPADLLAFVGQVPARSLP
jgi:PAS domain S-box-containing protein